MGKMMELMMGKMSQEERRKMMEEMMEKFLAGMTAEDRQKMMEGVDMMQMMPKMMTGMMGCGAGDAGMMDMMSKSGEGQRETEMSMMMEIMPKCLGMMLPRVPKEKRIDFVSTMITTLMQQGCAGMSEEEKGNFKAKVLGKF